MVFRFVGMFNILDFTKQVKWLELFYFLFLQLMFSKSVFSLGKFAL